jgi:hypothetical protein
MASRRLARLALALYPLAYRRRYGEEMAALLEDAGGSPGTALDLVRGAIRAHLWPERAVAGEVRDDDRLRLGISAVLFCWVLFTVAGLALYKTTEGGSFGGDAAPGLLGGVHLAIQILAGVGSLAIVLGAARPVVAALRQGRERPEVRRAVRLAGASAAAFAGATVALVAVAASGLAPGLDALILTAWLTVALAAGVGCAFAARHGLFATAVPDPALRFAAACAAIVAAAMAGIVTLLAVYLVDILVVAPDLAGESNGPLGGPSVGVSLALQLAAMAALTLPAGLGAWRARPEPRGR